MVAARAVLTALGMKKALQQVADTDHYDLSEPLHGVVAWALTAGVGLFVLAAAAILLRTTGRASTALVAGGLVLLCAGPAVAVVPALVALTVPAAAVAALLVLDRRTATQRGLIVRRPTAAPSRTACPGPSRRRACRRRRTP